MKLTQFIDKYTELAETVVKIQKNYDDHITEKNREIGTLRLEISDLKQQRSFWYWFNLNVLPYIRERVRLVKRLTCQLLSRRKIEGQKD